MDVSGWMGIPVRDVECPVKGGVSVGIPVRGGVCVCPCICWACMYI